MMRTVKIYICMVVLTLHLAVAQEQNQDVTLGDGNSEDKYRYCLNNLDNDDCQRTGTMRCDTGDRCYRAAVYEHSRIDKEECAEGAKLNLDVFANVTGLASSNGARIIVMPEDGIFIGSYEYIAPCLEEIPDPDSLDESNDNPCNQPQFYASLPILTRLSCIAKKNNIYIVANYGTKQTCQPDAKVGEKVCPERGFFKLNTNVVVDPSGRFIKRYRKYNPFIEVFDKAPDLEETYFDTPHGRFGVITCFDMIFQHPALDLVEKHHVDTVLFPTWWYDELPMLSAIQYQDAWSWMTKVNLLAANILKPDLGSTGSGIYSASKLLTIGPDHGKSKLLLANLPIHPRDNRMSAACEACFQPKLVDLDPEPTSAYRYKNYTLKTTDRVMALSYPNNTIEICTDGNSFCCEVSYEMDMDGFDGEVVKRVVMIVRNGRRPGRFNWYEQACALATIDNADFLDLQEIRYSKSPVVRFKQLAIKARFATKYVFPFGAHDVSNLIPRNQRNYSCEEATDDLDKTYNCQHYYTHQSPAQIYSFGMYGRIYDDDIIDYDMNIVNAKSD